MDQVRTEYGVTVPMKSAADVFDIEKLDIPAPNGGRMAPIQFIDNETLLTAEYDGETLAEYGLYNLSDKSYKSIGAFDAQICACSEDYLVLKKFDGDYTKTTGEGGDDSVKLYLYDNAQKKSELIFTYSFNRFEEFYKLHYQNGIVIKDGKVYFDDVIDDFTRVILY